MCNINLWLLECYLEQQQKIICSVNLEKNEKYFHQNQIELNNLYEILGEREKTETFLLIANTISLLFCS